MKQQRGAFKSNFGVMMAVTGSAVGLGNIWRFPYMAGVNGGAAFLLLYLLLVILVGLPLILSEFNIGRATHKGCVESFKELKPQSRWHWIGYLSVVAGFTIMGFYSVIAGWTMFFTADAIANGFPTTSSTQVNANFDAFVNSGWKPILCSLLFIVAAAAIVMRGVEKGIERFSKILMPVLLVILLILCVNSATLDGFQEGMAFLFKPDFSKITGTTILDALGQVFFTLSIGMGVMITYSSYVKHDENMLKSKSIVTLIDTSIAVISGIAIFPAVFTYGLAPAEGPGLVFKALPTVFAQMPFGNILGVLFFILLFIAAITSAVSIFEMMTAFGVEKYKISRRKAMTIIGLGVGVLAVLSALSQVQGAEMVILGMNFFDILDFLSANFMLTIGGLGVAIFTGWVFDKTRLYNTFTSNGKYAKRAFPLFLFIIRFIAPAAVSAIIISKILTIGD